ncbi:FAD/NAD(P)-binding domain-containing protein [Cryphonectria parasitica EP155]|uniref:FAD/NAD(P)-binding domain-containing protein n=1 Tax=Cryphonectria parasitica (strain ATCC 38755 / EP155) TaxID=660469 RepID=A0A9P5CQE6_CRYP1|nr:FAD/NAD(P)-binding domain-containing protein [Cryphonectria parasitica EP155]KAF3767148.1 FAD/NAD(P)-binding domain-containing protein [Cryphonectria parasitica EP155]
MAERPFKQVLIVGAGPAGLLLALLLSKHGIPVTIVEMSDQLDQQPRAAHYGPAATPDLQRAGILDELRAKGLSLNTMCWRRSEDHSYISGFDAHVLADVDGNDWRTVSYPLQDLNQLMLDRFLKEYNGNIKWQQKVVDVGQDVDKAWVDLETPDGRKRLEADYVVGCDGAGSGVRKALFGDEYPGFTWDAQIIATNTYYDFTKFGFHDANFIIHPEHFFMAAKLTADGLYRITYGETPGLSVEEYKKRQPWKFETILPGHPKPHEYKMINWAPYKMHQRCAPKFRVGRVMLAADAAHLCNPWGGLGITGGFVDCGGLYDCLAGIWDGKADESILDLYSEKRIEKYQTIINQISQENFRRVSDKEPSTRYERDEFMHLLTKGETDKMFLKKLLMDGFDVRYDFTQHYKDT